MREIMGIKNGRLLAYALAVLFLVGLYDYLTFFRTCRDYQNQSQLRSAQHTRAVDPQEILVVLTGDRNRIPRALELLRSRNSPLLVISGINPETTLTDLVNQQGNASQNVHEIWAKILVESKASSTIENAIETKGILQNRKVAYLVLVTSDYHLPRALQIFRRVFKGTEVIPYATPSATSTLPFAGKVTVEYAKYVLYRLWGRFRL